MIVVSLFLVAGFAALVFLSDSEKLTAPPEDFLSVLSGNPSSGEIHHGSDTGEVLAQKGSGETFDDFPESGFPGVNVPSAGIPDIQKNNESRKTGPAQNVPAAQEPSGAKPEGSVPYEDNAEKKPESVENKSFVRNPEVASGNTAGEVKNRDLRDSTAGEIHSGSGDMEEKNRNLQDSTAGLLVFVFDDGGHNLKDLTPIVNLPFPVTIAVLPGLGYSVKAAELVRQSGKELLLHQPMQAKNLSVDPGPGAIKPGMGYSDIVDLLIDNTNQVGPVVGMNNHEGSLITEDPMAMQAVLEFCRDRGLIFLDSRTTAGTVVPEQAEVLDMEFLERSVFIDNIQERESIVSSIRDGMNIAKNKGSAVLIGHVWCQSIADIILDIYPEILDQGYKITTLTELLNYKESGEESL